MNLVSFLKRQENEKTGGPPYEYFRTWEATISRIHARPGGSALPGWSMSAYALRIQLFIEAVDCPFNECPFKKSTKSSKFAWKYAPNPLNLLEKSSKFSGFSGFSERALVERAVHCFYELYITHTQHIMHNAQCTVTAPHGRARVRGPMRLWTGASIDHRA